VFVISSPGAENEGFINLLFVYCSHVMGCVAFENLGDLHGKGKACQTNRLFDTTEHLEVLPDVVSFNTVPVAQRAR